MKGVCFGEGIEAVIKGKSHSRVDKQTMGVKCPNKCMASGAFCSRVVIVYLWFSLIFVWQKGSEPYTESK